MRKKIIAANWKMNMDLIPGVGLFSEVLNMVRDEVRGSQHVIICPPFIHLSVCSNLLGIDKRVSLGAQNCHQAKAGAFTGEVSAEMVWSAGAKYVILGHSERRQYFAETNEVVAEKVNTALATGLNAIVCIGETLEERNENKHFELIRQQLRKCLFHLSREQFEKIIISYEPVWAIGTGLNAKPEQAQEVHAFIRNEILLGYGENISQNTSILYGGSCNSKNAKQLFAGQDIDGGLIGGASLDPRDFTDIVKVFNGE